MIYGLTAILSSRKKISRENSMLTIKIAFCVTIPRDYASNYSWELNHRVDTQGFLSHLCVTVMTISELPNSSIFIATSPVSQSVDN